VLDFDPFDAAVRKYPITDYQPVYYAANSFQQAKEQIIQFSNTINRPFSVRYNPYTQSVDILDSKLKITKFLKEIQGQLGTLSAAVSNLPGLD
jgi:phenylalanine-4-hydroxylase